MTRRLFTIVSAVSLLLCAATTALWVSSWIDGITVSEGQLLVYHADDPPGTFGVLRDWEHRSTAGIWRMLRNNRNWDPSLHERFGFVYGSGRFAHQVELPAYRPSNQSSRGVSVDVKYILVALPLWALFVLLAVLPACWAATRIRRRSRSVAGCCPTCGYDLRASQDRCPECGTPIAAT